MGTDSGFDEKAFQQKVFRIVENAYARMDRESQEIFDGVLRSHGGRSKAEAVEALRDALASKRLTLGATKLDELGKAIAEKRRVVLKDAEVTPEPVGTRLIINPSFPIDVHYPSSGNTVKARVHCWDSDSDVIGVIHLDFPQAGPHMTVHPHEDGETYEREYNAADLKTLNQIQQRCPFPD
jgi:hypothetical protein